MTNTIDEPLNTRTVDDMRIALAGKSVEQMLLVLAERFSDEIVFASSFGLEDQALTAMIAASGASIPVMTLDTQRLFPESYTLIEQTCARFPTVDFIVLSPDEAAVKAYVAIHGENGFYSDKALRIACCDIRKVQVLRRGLAGKSCWLTGLRAEQSAARTDTSLFAWDEHFGLYKCNPLYDWDDAMLTSYIAQNKVPVNVLHAQGFPSIGCAPCTRAIAADENPRAGRWWWESSSKECGLHENYFANKQHKSINTKG